MIQETSSGIPKKTVTVPQIPTGSSSMAYIEVSLPCPPWEQTHHTTANQTKSNGPKFVSQQELEARIISGLKAGKTRYRELIGSNVNGPLEDRTRAILQEMLEKGIVSRDRDQGGFLWSLAEVSADCK